MWDKCLRNPIDKKVALNIIDDEASKRQATMSGSVAPSKSPSPPLGGVDRGFNIGKSATSGLGVGASGKMIVCTKDDD
ncbi:hypothetical protein SUGI_0607160 [Cryptomeria japonica]|nr:hypothetical protein SUGI_0607160 [Cryptomeria japonica]